MAPIQFGSHFQVRFQPQLALTQDEGNRQEIMNRETIADRLFIQTMTLQVDGKARGTASRGHTWAQKTGRFVATGGIMGKDASENGGSIYRALVNVNGADIFCLDQLDGQVQDKLAAAPQPVPFTVEVMKSGYQTLQQIRDDALAVRHAHYDPPKTPAEVRADHLAVLSPLLQPSGESDGKHHILNEAHHQSILWLLQQRPFEASVFGQILHHLDPNAHHQEIHYLIHLIHTVVASQNPQALEMLLAQGASTDVPHGVAGNNLIHTLIGSYNPFNPGHTVEGQLACLDILLAHGLDKDAQNGYGFTPLLMAIEDGQAEMADHLLSKGCHVKSHREVPVMLPKGMPLVRGLTGLTKAVPSWDAFKHWLLQR